MATIISGGRIGRPQVPASEPQTSVPHEQATDPGIIGKITGTAGTLLAHTVGLPQDIYQSIESVVSNPSVQKAIVGPAADLIDLLPGGKLPIPERIPFLPNSAEAKERARETGKEQFGEKYMKPEGFIENSIDKAAAFIPSALVAAATSGASLAGAARGALGSGIGAEIGSFFGAPGEFIGTIIGDVAGKNPNALKHLRPRNIHTYMKDRRDDFWKSTDSAAKGILVPKETVSKLITPIHEAEKSITDLVAKGNRSTAQKDTIGMLQTIQDKLKKGTNSLKDLMDVRKVVNEYFSEGLTPYQQKHARYIHSLVIPEIDNIIAQSGNTQLQKDYGLANALSEAVGKSDRIQSALQNSGIWGKLKNNPLGPLVGLFYGIPKLMTAPFSAAAATTAASYAGKKLSPLYPYVDKRLLPVMADVTKALAKTPIDNDLIVKTFKNAIDKANYIKNQEKVERKNNKVSGTTIISGGRKRD